MEVNLLDSDSYFVIVEAMFSSILSQILFVPWSDFFSFIKFILAYIQCTLWKGFIKISSSNFIRNFSYIHSHFLLPHTSPLLKQLPFFLLFS